MNICGLSWTTDIEKYSRGGCQCVFVCEHITQFLELFGLRAQS